ncbi:hypothetical protein GBAR_LOCUS1071 [Geodia barretti]|uniref:Uncharacterized protein n=1 Tax=Geodia barretti TaxID=519541 RepID=A0AA35QUX8_GEOBA|nr:hypothetical protein GBAR_LOCUS1071 [Geodia barretti]
MNDPNGTPLPADDGGEDSSYLTISLVVGIPGGAIIVALVLAIFLMVYLTCKTSSNREEVEYRHNRFQGLSLEQQKQSGANHQPHHLHSSQQSPGSHTHQQSSKDTDTSSDDSMNPYD